MRLLSMVLLLSFVYISCSNQQPYHNDPVPEHDNFTIESEIVGETRVINVWTPLTYDDNQAQFPVLYMPDGGIKEDFPHIANTLDTLIRNGDIQPVMLVGIENTERGRDLTGFSEVKDDKKYCPLSDGASDFRAFILNELVPEINKKYRTTDYKGIVGESLAGLFVIETFLKHPESFDYYIAMDPSLWWNDSYLVKKSDTLLSQLPEGDLRLWFAGSSAKDISQYTIKLSKALNKSAPKNLSWKYSDEPKEEHHTIFRATKENAFKWSLKSD